MEVRNHKKERERLEHEVNSLKAKMFDLQEATKSTPSQKELTKKEQNEDQE